MAMIFTIRRLVILLGLVMETVSQIYTRNYGGYSFTLANSYLNKDAARTWCTQNGSTLLEIQNSSIQTLTVQFLSDIGIQFADGSLLYINGMRSDGSWNWVNGNIASDSISISNQEPGPANSFGYINLNPLILSIAASIPNTMRGFICQGHFDCTNGFLLYELCHKMYSSPTMTWFDARNQCLNDGGDLASFDFINDIQNLHSVLNTFLMGSSTTLGLWVGLRRQWWTWQTSNLEANYTNWQNGRPVYRLEDRCLSLTNSGADWKWIERDCTSSLQFVCLTVLPSISSSTTKITSTSSTSTTTTIAAVFKTLTASSSNPSTIYTNSSLSTPKALGDTNNSGKETLGIGLGVGIGGALIFAAIIIIVVFIILKRPGCPRETNPPDVTMNQNQSHYAEIPKRQDTGSTLDSNGNQFTQPTVVYSDLEIVIASSPSYENDSVSLISLKTATLAPPKANKATTHFTVDGQEYAEVKLEHK